MTTARVMWNQAGVDGKHDEAVIAWDFRRGHEVPVDAINGVLATFYNEDLHPFFYLAWNDDNTPAGLLVTECMDLEDLEIQAIYKQVVELAGQTTQSGEFEVRDVEV